MTLFASFRTAQVSGAVGREPQLFDSNFAFNAKLLPASKVAGRAAGRHVLVGIHGYNVDQKRGVTSLARLDAALALSDGDLFIGVLWPGDSHIGALGYPVEKATASTTGRNLAKFCNSHLATAASVSFVAHSLGARVALEAVRHLSGRAMLVCLAAAAIERTCLGREYKDAARKVERFAVLASLNDNVLKAAFPVGNLLAHFLDPTANPLSAALGFAGPPATDAKSLPPWQVPKIPAYDHGDYFPHGDAAAPYPSTGDQTKPPIDFFRRCFRNEAHGWPG